MSKRLQIMAALTGALVLGSMTFASDANAWTRSRTWSGPNGGTATWNGAGGPNHYRGAVTYTAPNGQVYRRVTNAHRGPNGWYASRRWAGPNGVYRASVGGRY